MKFETYILHIYGRDRNISDSLVGLVEEVGVEGKKPFRNLGQFWDVLNAKAGETVQGENEKRQKTRKGEYIMKASILTDSRVLTAKDESHVFIGIRQLLKKLGAFFADSFETDWEKKTGLLWREWSRRSDTR